MERIFISWLTIFFNYTHLKAVNALKFNKNLNKKLFKFNHFIHTLGIHKLLFIRIRDQFLESASNIIQNFIKKFLVSLSIFSHFKYI